MNTVTIPAHHLRNMLEAALLAAGKDNTLPTLCAVRFEWEPGQFGLVSTDRYKLVWATVPTTDVVEESSFLLGRTDATALTKMLPAKPSRLPEAAWPKCQIQLDEHKAVFMWEGGMATFETQDGEFPKYRSLIPTATQETEEIAFNVDYLSIVSKIKGVDKVWDFSFGGPNKPVLIQNVPDMTGDPTYKVMVMPVRRVR